MKKVLIFGLGFQGSKYANYFSSIGYEVFGVTKSGKNKKNILEIKKIFKSDEIFEKKEFFFQKYELIILAIFPYFEQEKIINLLLYLDLKIKIIIEKPVSNDLLLLEKLKIKKNYYFFSDEIILGKFYKKIFKEKTNLIFETILEKDNIEHIFGGFLLLENFEKYLFDIKIINNTLLSNRNLYYNISLDKIKVNCNRGTFKINTILFFEMFFEKSLIYLLNLREENNLFYKENYIKLKKYLIDLNIEKGKD